jgi:hypothetical protein
MVFPIFRHHALEPVGNGWSFFAFSSWRSAPVSDAAGWSAGAVKLGTKLPAWVSLHDPGRSASIRPFRITLINAVKYVTNLTDWPISFYSRARLFSEAARHGWLEPELTPDEKTCNV